jgi:hypothetical protein
MISPALSSVKRTGPKDCTLRCALTHRFSPGYPRAIARPKGVRDVDFSPIFRVHADG